MKRTPCILITSTFLMMGHVALWANPTGGQVAAGAASIAGGPGTLTINQASNKAIINWQTFSINSGELTKFVQPSSSSAVLNRVLGGQTSIINGTLSANGQVYLINGNGIIVGPGGVITANAFTASTRDIADADFLGGNLHFTGSSGAGVQNFGTIDALGGNVYLIGKTVDNEGGITAPGGTVGLVSGDDVLLAQTNTDGSTITVNPSSSASSAKSRNAVTNGGSIVAANAELRAANGNLFALAINNSGTIRATTVVNQGGRIFLVADRGKVENSGTLNASATVAGGTGGTIVLKSGGSAHAGGTFVARGGAGGTGGQVEISAGTRLVFNGLVDLTAPGGRTGTLILDPATLNVVTDGTGTISSGENDSCSVTIDPSTVETALATSNVILNADNSITITNGIVWTSGNTLTLSTTTSDSTITINASIVGLSGTLKIDTASATDLVTTGSGGSIEVNNFILQSGQWSQNMPSLPTFAVTGNFALQGGSFLRALGGDGTDTPYLITDVFGLQGIATLPAGDFYALANGIDASVTRQWNSGLGFIPIGNSNVFTGSFDGQDYAINGLYINQPSTYEVGLFGLTSGAVIANTSLTNVSVTGDVDVGALVGEAEANTLVQFCQSSGTVAGAGDGWVGGLVGYNEGGSVVNDCFSSAAVTSNFVSGGLVGENYYGAVQYGSSSGSATTTDTYGYSFAGGLVGGNYGTISNSESSASATIIGETGDAGGLSATIEDGSITSSFSTGVVSGPTEGGLAGGSLYGTATDSYFDSQTSGIVSSNGAGTPEPSTFFTNPANYPPSWNFTTVWEFVPESLFPVLRDNPHYFAFTPPTATTTTTTSSSTPNSDSLLDVFDAYTANGTPGVLQVNFNPSTNFSLVSVDDSDGGGGAINDGSGSNHKGKNIASGSSFSNLPTPTRLLGPGSGINSIFNGNVAPVQPPIIVLQKFEQILNFDSQNALQNAALGTP